MNYGTMRRTETGRSLRWERGLKSHRFYFYIFVFISRSLRWERGLKSVIKDLLFNLYMSLPSLGAWIEVLTLRPKDGFFKVAPFAGSVD